MQKLTLVSVLAMLCLFARAQQPSLKPLTIGDTLPDITLTNIFNYKAPAIRLSDLKGKFIILDFWSTWCGACIASFPKMEKLQKDYNDQLQIILVNSYEGDTPNAVSDFFKRYKKATNFTLKLPYALLQQKIKSYFPHNAIPHLIWIGKDGVVAAITSSTEVTPENINKVLKGGKELHIKKDVIGYDYTKPLFTNGNKNLPDTFLYRSILTPYIEGLGSRGGIVKDSNGMVTMVYDFNKSALGLVLSAYSDNPNISKGRFLLETTNKVFNRDQNWYNNSYCYQLSLPPCAEKDAINYMQEDIARLFHIRVTNEQRESSCLLLTTEKYMHPLNTEGGTPSFSLNAANSKKYISNEPLDAVCKYFEDATGILFINKTGFTANVDMHFSDSFDVTNKDMLIKALAKMGFGIKESKCTIQYAIVRDLP